MARRARPKPDCLDQALSTLRARLGGTPLECVSGHLGSMAAFLQEELRAGRASPLDGERLAEHIGSVVAQLPQTFNSRFRFDAGLINALAEEWCQGGVSLSAMIVPSYAREWGHRSVPLASLDRTKTYVIDLIQFPGRDRIEEVDLLEYPFLCHELGHNLLFQCDQAFAPAFDADLDRISGELQRRSLADKGAARVLARQYIDELRRFWKPSGDHFNWAHEIAVDVIAFWACGPAYAAALQDVLEQDSLNPYQVGQSHPPYEVRAIALIRAGRELGWEEQLGDLRELLETWKRSKWRRERDNHYLALTLPDLIRACVERALGACADLGLPRCTSSTLQEVGRRLDQGILPELGTELLLVSWLNGIQSDGPLFDAWERSVIEELTAQVTL